MRTSLLAAAGLAAACALVGVSATGCNSNSKPSTATSGSATSTTASHGPASTSAPAQPTDYARLLIRAEDINAPETFAAGAVTQNPDGKEGVAVTFSVADGSHVIHDTILILPDPRRCGKRACRSEGHAARFHRWGAFLGERRHWRYDRLGELIG